MWFAFDVGYQNYTQFSYEWIAAPENPPNIYADFLKAHREGIQHLGMPVDDLSKLSPTTRSSAITYGNPAPGET